MERLVLGTAQLGLAYGIANRTGQPGFDEATAIVARAWDAGIREFDTASAYGTSQDILGDILNTLGISNEARIMTKLHPKLDHRNQHDLEDAMEKARSTLKTERLYGMLLHGEEHLQSWNQGLGQILTDFVKAGIVEHIGVSVYSPAKAIEALETDGITIVQIPSNMFDRRFERSGVFDLAEKRGKHLYVRSVFLQGLLLLDDENVPDNLRSSLPFLRRIENIARGTGASRHSLALGYARDAYQKAKIIIGVETLDQLEDNVKNWRWTLPADVVDTMQNNFENMEDSILNPSLWANGRTANVP